jgi:ubiquinone/menaquinone biosynthesis C-methylase UbiE
MPDARLDKRNVPATYRKVAPIYDLWARLTESKARDRCLELAAIQDGEAVLEVAVGTGLAFEKILLANPSGRVEGVDLTDGMLLRAERRAAATGLTNYRLGIGDAYQLEFADDSFDVLINNYMFDLLPERDFPEVLAEFGRVLRPRGRLVVVNMANGERWYNGMWPLIYKLSPALLGGCRGVSLLGPLRDAGFQHTRREYLSQATFPSEVITGINTHSKDTTQ